MSSVDLDPRFDPRFQRGYDAERHRPVPESVAPDVVAAPAVVAASPMAAAPLIGAAPPIVDELPADEEDLDGFPDEPIRRRNPYFVALIALPVGLLGAGAYLVVLFVGDLSKMFGSVWDDYTIITMVPMIAPALIATGFAALVIVLAQLALGRGRRG